MIDHHTEAKRFDPDGHYVRRWLPVLARLRTKYIHEPWLAPEGVLEDAGGCQGSATPPWAGGHVGGSCGRRCTTG